jgi:hypothetical protein
VSRPAAVQQRHLVPHALLRLLHPPLCHEPGHAAHVRVPHTHACHTYTHKCTRVSDTRAWQTQEPRARQRLCTCCARVRAACPCFAPTRPPTTCSTAQPTQHLPNHLPNHPQLPAAHARSDANLGAAAWPADHAQPPGSGACVCVCVCMRARACACVCVCMTRTRVPLCLPNTRAPLPCFANPRTVWPA